VSQHLAKLRAYGLATTRRDAQTIYYRLTDHAFLGKLRHGHFDGIGLDSVAATRAPTARRPI
jgi:DNA-binding transcriptional ArsR family regulator